MSIKPLTNEEQKLIRRIADTSIEINPDLELSKSYSITLLYYLTQFTEFDLEQIPNEYYNAVKLLYKPYFMSYIHYWNEIQECSDPYVHAIKAAEIKELGDDPRCHW